MARRGIWGKGEKEEDLKIKSIYDLGVEYHNRGSLRAGQGFSLNEHAWGMGSRRERGESVSLRRQAEAGRKVKKPPGAIKKSCLSA